MSDEPQELPEPAFHVVALGASAGGLTALQRLLAEVPPDSGMAFVVVVHLSPDHESHMVEVLTRHARIPVRQVTRTMALRPNCVYIIPPAAHLETIDSHLRLSELEASARSRATIDHFLRTLAESHGRLAIGVVLSGTGSDGTLGLRQVKECGGLTIVQDPEEAEHDAMVRSALTANDIDLTLPAAEIPAALLRFVSTAPAIDLGSDGEPSSETLQFLQQVFAKVRARTGRDFSHYKRSTMTRRVARRMQFHQLGDPDGYLTMLDERPDEARALADDLLITVTQFFRDPEVFEALASDVLPRLFDGRGPEDTIRVWSLACATGEEAYSLAMLLAEESERRDHPPEFQVFATDLHAHSLDAGREGLFPGDIELDVSAERLGRFFQRENGSYRVKKALRERVLFAVHNVLADPPFSRLDLISSRNFLIYLKRDIHQRMAELFHYALRPGGHLLLGTSESTDVQDLFQVVNKNKCLFRKRNVPGPEPRLPTLPLAHARSLEEPIRPEVEGRPMHYVTLHREIVSQHTPPSLLVGPDDQVLHLTGRAGRFLVPPDGPMTSSVFKLVRKELRVEMHAAMQDARRSNQEVRTQPVSVGAEGERCAVAIHVQPALDPELKGFLSVQFEERQAPRGPSSEGKSRADEKSAQGAVDQLEEQNRALQQRLQQSVDEHETSQEELRAANEELQSANEELRSTLEELETSKEELQSINEELQTVNQENRHKVDELAHLSNDLQNLLVATDIGTLFLDRELRILKFTPKLEVLFNVLATDRGRPISDLTTKLGYDQLPADGRRVLQSLVPVEREVKDDAGRWYLTRVLPYRTSEERIVGVVLTLVDITKQKAAEEEARRARAAAERVIESLPQPLLVLGGDLTVRSANAAFYEYFGLAPETTINYRLQALGGRQWDLPELRDLLEKVLPQNSSFDDYLVEGEFDGLGRRIMLVNGRRLDDMDLILLGMHDITDRYDAESALRASEDRLAEENRHKDEYLAMLGHELRNPLGALRAATDLLRHDLPEVPRLARAYGVLERQTAHMSRIIDDLLDVSRIARGKAHVQLVSTELGEVLRRLLEVRETHAAKRGLTLHTDLPSKAVYVKGDEARLVQIFDNLIGNAIKFTDAGGTVSVALTEADADLVVCIRDDGLGIRPEMLDRVFDAFRQEEQDRARTTGGLGLGLALAKGLVELHGGTLRAKSEGLGHGAEFEVRLPRVPAPEVESQSEAAPSSRPRPLQILVVEDNLDAGEMLRNLLELHEHDVEVATNGAQALRRLRERCPELVICDLGLPEMDGVQLAQAIREDPALAHLPLIALTGYGQPDDRRSCAEAGFDAHLTKPIDMKTLDAALQSEVILRKLPSSEQPSSGS